MEYSDLELRSRKKPVKFVVRICLRILEPKTYLESWRLAHILLGEGGDHTPTVFDKRIKEKKISLTGHVYRRNNLQTKTAAAPKNVLALHKIQVSSNNVSLNLARSK